MFGFLIATLIMSLQAYPQSGTGDIRSDREKAILLAEENRYLDAYPLLQSISSKLQQDKDVWTHYGIAIAIRSATLSDSKERKLERKRALEALMKARILGTKNVIALDLLDQLYPDGGTDDNFLDANPDVEKALREGESLFSRGDYANAFTYYEKAYHLNPKSYEAAVFAGDTFYSQKKYKEAEPWFERAVAVDPDREMALRFWGDALLAQNKIAEAQEKFIDAFIAEPYKRYAWENINKLTRAYGKYFDVKGIFPPGTENFGEISIDRSGLSASDGTELWLKFVESKEEWRANKFKKEFANMQYRESLKEMVESLRAVAAAASEAIKSGKLKKPHHSLQNLIEINNDGFLEAYILLLAASEGVSQDYDSYRSSNRTTLRRFLTQRVFVLEGDKK